MGWLYMEIRPGTMLFMAAMLWFVLAGLNGWLPDWMLR